MPLITVSPLIFWIGVGLCFIVMLIFAVWKVTRKPIDLPKPKQEGSAAGVVHAAAFPGEMSGSGGGSVGTSAPVIVNPGGVSNIEAAIIRDPFAFEELDGDAPARRSPKTRVRKPKKRKR